MLLALLLIFSCKKKDEPTCDYKGMIYFSVAKEAPGPFNIYINKQLLRQITGGEVAVYQKDTGLYELGYLGSGVSGVDSLHLTPCATATYNIP